MNETEGLHFLEHVAALQIARRESFAAGVVIGGALVGALALLLHILQ